MTKKFKKWLLIGLSAACLTSSVFGVACSEGDGEESEPTATEYELILRYDTQTISVGESVQMIIDEYNGERDVVWTSADSSIATVADGVVTGVSAGVTTITATAGSASADCMVFVKDKLITEETIGLELALSKSALYIDETATLQARLQGATAYEYLVSDENVAMVSESGTITAKAEGVATITVHATANGKTYSKAVSVTVKPDWEVSISTNSLTLDALASWGNKTYANSATVTASVLYRGVAQTGENVTWTTLDESVATVTNGEIRAQKVGEAVVVASYEKDGRTYVSETNVQVQPAALGAITEPFDIPIETDYAFADVTGYDTIPGEAQSAAIEINGARYEIASNGAATFLIPKRFSNKNVKIVVSTDKAEASFTVGAYIDIANYEDLTMLYESTSGYYKLTDDIDMTELAWSYPTKTTFSGVFNGGGNEIKGLQLTGAHGLFYEVENDVTITDLTLTDVRMTGKATLGSLFATDKDKNTQITVENVQVDATLSDSGVGGGLFGVVYGTTTLKNVTVHTYQAAHDTTTGGALFGTVSGKLTAENVTAYSALWHTTSKTAPTMPTGLTLVAPTVFKSNNQEIRLNFLSNVEEYTLTSSSGVVDNAKVYYANRTETTDSTFALSETDLSAMGGKNIEILTDENGDKAYYYIPVSDTGHLNKSNFHKLPNVSTGTVLLDEDIDFAEITAWTQATKPPYESFSGTFDGQGHTISNFTGRMFGTFMSTATAKNFTLLNAQVTFAGQGLVCDLMTAKSTLENVTIVAKLGYFEKSGVIARYMADNVNLKNVNILAFSTLPYNQGFLSGFGTKGASANCTDCLFVATNEQNTFMPCGIRDGGFINTIDEMGENYTKVLRGDYTLFNSPTAFITAATNGELTESKKTVYDEVFKAVLDKEVKSVSSVTDLKELCKGEATYYYLTQDIDCAGVNFNDVERDTGKTYQVIIEGNGHAIKNLPDYLFYNFQGRIQNLAFTDIKAGASVCKVAKGGALVNVFMHGEIVRDADGGLYAQELNAYKSSADQWLLMKDVVMITTNAQQYTQKQGFIVGYAAALNYVTNENSVFISKYSPLRPKTDKNDKGAYIYVTNLEGVDEDKKYDGVLKGDYGVYAYASDFDAEYTGTLSAQNQTYYELLKDDLEEKPAPAPEEDQSGDALIPDRDWVRNG
ncbi:MAG: Ig-like domain-containing protein [Clostridia bacterium]|nr:Ig-like domain-containing protein [Clostridia bacterium]